MANLSLTESANMFKSGRRKLPTSEFGTLTIPSFRETQTDRQTGSQANRKTDTQTHSHADLQTHAHRHRDAHAQRHTNTNTHGRTRTHIDTEAQQQVTERR